MSEKQTLQDELEAAFKEHQIDASYEPFTYDCLGCKWLGTQPETHLAEIATRVTNARVEGLIREAAESGFKMREAVGTLEYGVAYTEKAGQKMTRVMAGQYPSDNTKEIAEEFLTYWTDNGNEAFLVTRQWRRAE